MNKPERIMPALPSSPPSFENIIAAASNEAGAENYDKKLAENEKKDKFEDHNRTRSYKKHLHGIVVFGMYVLGVILISFIVIRAWHLATPLKLQWLNNGQLHTVDTVLFSSVIFSLASKYFAYYKLFQKQEANM